MFDMLSRHAYFMCIEDNCRSSFDLTDNIYTCPSCESLLDVAYQWNSLEKNDWKKIFNERRNSNLPLDISGVWRFREFLPFYSSIEHIITLFEGNTPIYSVPKSAKFCGLKSLRVKHQGLNPTGSFKDNGMTASITAARQFGSKAVMCASTGNTSASMAAYAAQAEMKSIVFIPGGQIAFGKLSQSLDYGAITIQIDGNFDDALKIVQEISKEMDIYLMNSINPFRLEGQKTIAFEMAQQLDWNSPDHVVVPGGNLGNISAIGKGFFELYNLGLIDKIPKISVIQAEGSSPLAKLWHSNQNGTLEPLEKPWTLATAIKIGNPVSWKKAVNVLKRTHGSCISVTEQEIADAKAMIGRDGISCEPASATAIAGIRKMVKLGDMDVEENVVAILTGNGLKDPDYTVQYHLEELYQHAERRVELIHAQDKLVSNFSNKPIQIVVDKNVLYSTLEKLIGI